MSQKCSRARFDVPPQIRPSQLPSPARLGGLSTWMTACVLMCICDISPAAAQGCAGDCDGDNAVAINELITGVSISLGILAPSICTAFDTNADGTVMVNELVAAVTQANNDCNGVTDTATPDVTDTPADGGSTPTRTPTTRDPTHTHTRGIAVTPTPTATRPSPTTAVPSGRVIGACRRPGPAGLIACDEGTVIRVFRCDNQFTCAQRFGGRTRVGEGTVGSSGNFSVAVDPDLAGSALLVLEAEIEATIFRALDIGRAGAGAGSGRGAGVTDVVIAPTSEASVEILDGNGLGNFPEEGFVEVSTAVETANAGTNFAGLSAADAAQLAEDNARGNAGVTDAVMQNRSGRLCVDSVWRAASSPFVVVNTVIVGGGLCPDGQQDVTLTIEPGVEVRFREGLGLRVRSTIVARGTPGNPIVFTSDQEFPEIGDWIGLLFEDSATDGARGPNGEYQGGSILEHTVVTWAKGVSGSPGAVTLEAANPILRDLTVRDCGAQTGRGVIHLSNTGGLVTERLLVEMNDVAGGPAMLVTAHQGAPVQIIDSAILDNEATGLLLSGPSIVRDTLIRGNSDGIECRSTNVTVLRTTVTDNDGTGVNHSGSGGELRVRESTITSNRGEALRCTQGRICEVSDTLIAGNRLGTFMNANCLLRRNCFFDNGAGATDNPGIVINGGIAGDLTDNTLVGDSILMSFGQVLNIHRNNLLGTPFALETREQIGRPDFDVSENWWGTTNDDAILGSVIDCNTRPVACIDPFPEAQAPIAAAPDIEACAEGRLEPGQ